MSDRSRRFAGVGLVLVAAFAALAEGQAAPDGASHHVYELKEFRLESGVTLPNATLVYATYGHLSARRDNAILLPSHYMADHHGYDWLIGPALALDTTRYFLIATEMFGNGHSSSPSNTPEPFHGPRFPVTTIRDNVAAVSEMLSSLGIAHLQGHHRFLHGRGASVPVGGEPSGHSWTVSWLPRERRSAMGTASCGWKGRSPR